MTRGLPPGAAVRLRAGAFVPPAVASVFPLPVWLVFVGTVLLSVVLGGAGCGCGRRGTVPGSPPPRSGDSPDSGGRRRANAPSAGHGKPLSGQGAGGDAPWACRHLDQRSPAASCSLGYGGYPRAGQPGERLPATTSPMAARVGRSAS